MTERGGLDYTIKVRQDFRKPLEDFKRGVAGVRQEIAALKRQAAAFKSIGKDVQAGAAAIAASQARSAKSSKDDATETSRAARAAKELLTIRNQLASQARRLRTIRSNKDLAVLRQELQLEREKASLAAASQRAQQRDTAAASRRTAVFRAHVAAANKLAVATDQQAKKMQIVADAAARLTRIERERAALNNRTLRQAEAQVAAERAIAKFKSDQVKFEKLAAFARSRGLAGNAAALKQLGFNQARLEQFGFDLGKQLGPDQAPSPSVPDKGLAQRVKEFLGFGDVLSRVNNQANRVSFTFRRLFGILAAFTLARVLIQQFVDLVKTMATFNSRIEQVRIGVAALLIAVGAVSDATGTAAEGAESLAIAQQEARRQTDLLRRDAIKTVATFDQLAETFQTAIAPGLQAGLDIDQIRAFTVSISQAAAAIGVSQDQLAEEVRSIFGGTISARQTRIATALGITNDDIKNAKELGNLFGFLQDRFQAFGLAGEVVFDTFESLVTNVKDAFLLLLGEGGVDFFESIKTQLRDIRSLLITEDATGLITPNPAVVAIFKEIGDALVFAVAQGRALSEQLTLEDAVNGAQAIGNIIKGLAATLRPVVAGISKAVSDLSFVFDTLSFVFDQSDVFSGIVTQLVRIVALSFSVLTIWGLFRGVLSPIITLLGRVLVLMKVQEATITSIQAKTFLWLGRFFALAAVAGVLFSLFAGNPLSGELTNAATASGRIAEDLGKIPGIVRQSNQQLRVQAEVLKQIADDLEESQDSLRQTTATLGLEGAVGGQREEIIKKSIALRKDALKIDQQRDALLERQAQIQSQLQAKQREVVNEFILQKNAIEESVKLGQELIRQQSKLAAVRQQLNPLVSRRESLSDTELDRLSTLQREEATLNRNIDQIAERIRTLAEDATQDIGTKLSANVTDAVIEGLKAVGLEEPGKNAGREIEQATRASARKSLEDIVGITKEIITLEGQQVSTEDQLVFIAQQRLDLESKLAEVAALRNIARSREDIFQSDINERLLEAEARTRAVTKQNEFGNVALAAAVARIDEFKTKFGDVEQLSAKTRDNLKEFQQGVSPGETVNEALSTFGIEEQRRLREELDLLDQIGDAEAERDRAQNRPEQLALIESVSTLENQLTQTLKENNQERDKERFNLEELQRTAERALPSVANLGNGVLEGIRRANEELPTIFEQTAQITQDAIGSIASFISSTISAAFDPSNDKSIRERLSDLLRGIGESIVQSVIQNVIVQILSVIPGFAAAAVPMQIAANTLIAATPGLQTFASTLLVAASLLVGAGGFVGAHTGGNVGDAFKKARGFAAGGAPNGIPNTPVPSSARPRGLHPSDTVPIWASPNEWVIRANAVAKYGSTVMDAINRGLIDPFELRSLAGTRRAPMRRRHRLGFAEGGSVSGASPASSTGEGRGSVSVAFVVGDETAMETLLKGGENAMLSFLESRSSKINAILKR